MIVVDLLAFEFVCERKVRRKNVCNLIVLTCIPAGFLMGSSQYASAPQKSFHGKQINQADVSNRKIINKFLT